MTENIQIHYVKSMHDGGHRTLHEFTSQFETDYEIHRHIVDTNRDYVFAISDNEIVGLLTVFNQEKSMRLPIDGVLTISMIKLLPEYENKGIASQMFLKAVSEIQNQGKIVMRTEPTDEGEDKIYNKFTALLESNQTPYIAFEKSYDFAMMDKIDGELPTDRLNRFLKPEPKRRNSRRI